MREEPGSDLPAPYVSPWSLLRQDLRAVIASSVLSLREALRRNIEGSLPRPGFWPQPLAPLFWPALLLGLACVVALVLVLTPLRMPRTGGGFGPGPALSPAPAEDAAAATAASTGAATALESPPMAAAPAVTVAQPAPGAAAPSAPAAEPSVTVPVAAEPQAALTPPTSLAPSEELTLLARLIRPESEGLLLAAQADPAHFRLALVLAASFRSLPPSRQQHLAEGWQEQARLLGYEQLELLDPAGQCLARSARIGSGMILFTMASGT